MGQGLAGMCPESAQTLDPEGKKGRGRRGPAPSSPAGGGETPERALGENREVRGESPLPDPLGEPLETNFWFGLSPLPEMEIGDDGAHEGVADETPFGWGVPDPQTSTVHNEASLPLEGIDSPGWWSEDPPSPPQGEGPMSPERGSFDGEGSSAYAVRPERARGTVPRPPSPAAMPFMHGRSHERAIRHEEGPWSEYGLPQRPSWWHYWEERNAPQGEPPSPGNPPLEDEHSPERDIAPPPEVSDDGDDDPPPPPDASSALVGDYWRTRRMRRNILEESRLVAHPPPFNFHAPPLRDGAWNRSTHVSSLIRDGFTISVNENMRGKAPRRLELSRPIEKDYILQMVADGILEKREPRFSVPHFFLERGSKLRLIFDGRRLNKAVATPPKFAMKSHATIAALSQRSEWHASDDLSNMFFSIKLAEEVRPMFGIKTNIGNFCYTALPFGFSWAPFIAHIAVDQICQRAIEAGLKVTHYLDDFHYFGSNQDEVEYCREFVRKLLDEAGWVLNTKKAVEPGRVFTALGVEYNLITKKSRIPPEGIKALERSLIEYRSSTISRRKLASYLGSLVFYGNAVPGSLTLCEDLIQIVASPKFDWGARYHTHHVMDYLKKAVRLFKGLGWCPLQKGMKDPQHLYTDATPTRIAFVWGNRVESMPIKSKQIYRAEADAIHFLLTREGLPKEFILRTDNEALMYALRKGRSKIFESARVCRDILALRLKGHKIAVKWISTDVNPADAPSRDSSLGLDLLTDFV